MKSAIDGEISPRSVHAWREFGRDLLGHVARPTLGGVESDDAALEVALRIVYAAMWIGCPDNAGRAMAIFVRCIDNTLANDVLSVGEIYEVMHINERDGYYALSGLGQFTMARFQLVPLRRPATVDAIEV